MPTRRRSLSALAPALGLSCALGFLGVTGTARAQTPQPRIPEISQRSGLIQRFQVIEPHLPPDPRRDQWYDTRWGDPPNIRPHHNFYPNGGMYGLPWKDKDSASIYPYFYGSPGRNTITEDSRPPRSAFWRPLSAMVHPFKPVGMYYEQGSYVPVYDLDPVVPGPGPMIFPWFRALTNWGG